MAELEDTDELRSFRQQWKQELRIHKSDAASTTSKTDNQDSSKQEGLKMYKMGLQAEKKGNFNVAISFYKQAFKMDPQLEYWNTQRAIDASLEQKLPDNALNLEEFPHTCEPAAETKQTHISVLPTEVLLRIFRFCEPVTVDYCARTCRGWYLIARQQDLWRRFCAAEWNEYIVKYEKDCKNWRLLYIDWPRLRFDGIYYSKNIYIRSGDTEGRYFQPVHQVHYFRYLRFFKDGRCVSAMSFDKPKDVVQLLTSSKSSNETTSTSASSTSSLLHHKSSASSTPSTSSTSTSATTIAPGVSLQTLKNRSNLQHGTYTVIDEHRIALSLRGIPNHHTFNFLLYLTASKTVKGVHGSKLQVIEYNSVSDSTREMLKYPESKINRFLFTLVPEGLLPS
eukprot:TRINITY_DN8708_c0_g1_i1.p1 TRINITY_DN8708_c0_g1~~TRINITY_DN8708_c0_g1_i1.p1  ORF type:complete len:394 (-),score=80.18 TRINITY_DN8708_c0_g1_i1:142-1323(-)